MHMGMQPQGLPDPRQSAPAEPELWDEHGWSLTARQAALVLLAVVLVSAALSFWH